MVKLCEKLITKIFLYFVYMKYYGEIQCNMEHGWAYTVYRNMSVELVSV